MSFIDRCRKARGAGEEDEGFTLIELLVVLLIIGILLAIAIPTFLSVTKGANNTAAQSNLQTALTGADTYYTNANQSFTGIMTASGNTASTLTQIDTGLSYTYGGASTNNHVVSIYNQNGNVLVLMAYSPGTNDCWGILDVKSTQTAAPTGFTTSQENTGTYFFVSQKGTATNSSCKANGGVGTVATIQTSGFPKG